MVDYAAGTVFETAQTFGPDDTFGEGCVFAAGTVFNNPCTLGDGCVGEQVTFALYDYYEPPSTTGAGGAWGCGSIFLYVILGEANTLCMPILGIAIPGVDNIIGAMNNVATGDTMSHRSDECRGTELVSGSANISRDYDQCGKVCGDGIVAGSAQVKDPSRCI